PTSSRWSPIKPRAICLRCCDLTTPVSIKRGEPCCMSCSPLQATSASPIASCISPWIRSARRIERTPPRPSVRCSTKRRQSSPALACGFGSQCVRHPVSGLPSPARRSTAAPPRLLPRFPNRRRNRTFLRYPMSGGLRLGLTLLCPLFLAVAILIKLDSRGPIFIHRNRRGYNDKTIRILKFRTTETEENDETVRLALGTAPRVTRLGHIFRRSDIDALPQLVNVLRGEMSIVGPPQDHAFAHQISRLSLGR